MSLDGLLVVDKPVGPTSHDVVSRVRRILRERRIGHTGTLDPLASGVLLLVVGRATRLVQFMNADEKRYEATIRLGFATDTYDAQGRPTTSTYAGAMPTRDRIDEALNAFRGTFVQQPPAFSAKKIEGRRSYRLARAHQRASGVSAVPALPVAPALPVPPALPAPVSVTVTSLEILEVEHDRVQVAISCSSGFYVRSLAHDLGVALGVGAHLTALRRTQASGWTVAGAVPLARLEEPLGADRARQVLVPLADVLPNIPRLTLTAGGARRAASGCDLGASDVVPSSDHAASERFPPRVRLLNAAQNLVGIADLTQSGLLHPVVVLM